MNDPLHDLVTQIHDGMTTRGLVRFPGILDTPTMPTVDWTADWATFLDLAQQAQATLIYSSTQRYDPATLVSLAVAEADHLYLPTLPDDTTADEWLATRLREHLAPWDRYQGQMGSIQCLWCKEGIGHYWQHLADWYHECHTTIAEGLETVRTIAREQRVHHDRETAQHLHTLATEMAHHPRFPEATSEEKRAFMAQQLFPEVTAQHTLGARTATQIALRASLIYWWDVEPGERVYKAERARHLHRQGESIRNIMGILGLSEAKVRAALREDP